MNKTIKTKVNRLGLIGVILSIILIVSALINCVLYTNSEIRDISYRHSTESMIVHLLGYLPCDENGNLPSYTIRQEGDKFYFDYYDAQVSSYNSVEIEDPETYLAKNKAEFALLDACGIERSVRIAASVVVYVFLLLAAEAFRRCDSPFEDHVIRRMKVFAWVMLANALFGLVMSLAEEIGIRIILPGISGYYTSSGILETVLRLATPSFPLVASLVILFLVRIFRHGAELQKESDETL